MYTRSLYNIHVRLLMCTLIAQMPATDARASHGTDKPIQKPVDEIIGLSFTPAGS